MVKCYVCDCNIIQSGVKVSTVGPRLSEHLCATSMSKVFR